MFDLIDTDGSGSLSLEEVVLYLKSITDDISEDNIQKIFEGIDTSGDKAVDFEEFKVEKTIVIYIYYIFAGSWDELCEFVQRR